MKQLAQIGLVALIGITGGMAEKAFASAHFMSSAACQELNDFNHILHANSYVYNPISTSGYYILCPADSWASYTTDPSTTSGAHTAFTKDNSSTDAIACLIRFGDNVGNVWSGAWTYTCSSSNYGCSSNSIPSFHDNQQITMTSSTSGQTNVSTMMICYLPKYDSTWGSSLIYGYSIDIQ